MDIYEMHEKGKETGLTDADVFPYGNPQRLTMGELARRIQDIEMTKDLGKFRGGAWLGD